MPISATGSDRARRPPGAPRGFTLVELLVVVLLIGLVVSLAVLSIRTLSPAERLQEEAARLHARMDLAREEAVLRAQSLGLAVDRDGYRFLQLAEGGWQTLADDRLLAVHELPDDTRLAAAIDGVDIALDDPAEAGDGDDPRPQIFFLASGEILPGFRLRLTADGTDSEFIIQPGDEQWIELKEQDG